MLVSIANSEDPDQTASSSRSVLFGLFGRQLGQALRGLFLAPTRYVLVEKKENYFSVTHS